MVKKITDTYKNAVVASLNDSDKELRRKNKALVKETIALRKDAISVFKKIMISKEAVATDIAEHAPGAVDTLVEIMHNPVVSAQTRALIAFGFIDRVGMSTAQVNKDLDKQEDIHNNPNKMSLEDISKMLTSVNNQIAAAKVVSADSTDISST